MVSIVPTNFSSPLSGNEVIRAYGQNSSAVPACGQDFLLTTGQIAALAASETSFTSTNITTVGNGTLTAASMVGDQIVRTGPVAAFSDTTDTAVAIIAAFPGGAAQGSNYLNIKNATAFTQTLVAGVGVTLPLTVIIPPFSVGEYVVVPTSATTVSLTHIETNPISIGQNTTAPSITALSTVGAGTILATAFASSFVARSGAQSFTAFTDTTDTAAAIIAACANLVNKIGAAFVFVYVNNTNAPATVTGGSGVTVSGQSVVPANGSARFLVTYTAAATLTMVGFGVSYFPSTGTYINNGATAVTVSNAAVTANSIISFTLKTVGGTVSASAPNVKTITPGTGFTVAGLASDTSTYNYEIRG